MGGPLIDAAVGKLLSLSPRGMRARLHTTTARRLRQRQFAKEMTQEVRSRAASRAPRGDAGVTAGRFAGVAAPTPALRGSARPATGARRRVRVLYRVAAGPRLGFGHLLRVRALADAMGGTAWLSVRGGRHAIETAHGLGFRIVPAGDPLPPIDVLVIDDPHAGRQAQWVRRGRTAGVVVVVVQDAPGVSADLVVYPGVCAFAHPRGVRVLAGPRFALLDPELPARAASAPGHAPRVLVALGGGVHVRRVAQPLRARVPDADVEVAGGFAGGLPPLSQGRWLAPGRRSFLSALADCDAAIVAGGVTLLEACAAGVPTVALAVVPAQRPAIRALSGSGAVVDAAGLASTHPGRVRATRAVARLLADRALAGRLSRRARAMVDGRGAQRVARAIRALVAGGRRP
jgi:spore coat polysaccharide biosynthesis predicted glycosyltransferase SpsG